MCHVNINVNLTEEKHKFDVIQNESVITINDGASVKNII